jgi:putative transposase
LVERCCDWRWCSAHARANAGASRGEPILTLGEWPVDRPRNWNAILDAAMPKRTLEQVRISVTRGRPFGPDAWVCRTARRLGLTQTLNPPGRPPGKRSRNQS